jgi:Glycosyl hydrolases family 16
MIGAAVAAAAAALSALASPHVASAAQSHPRGDGFPASCIGYCKRPTNAAEVFKWGRIAWREEFETGTLGDRWWMKGPGQLVQQEGMLTIEAGTTPTTISVWPHSQSPRQTTGRWEARIRAYEKSTTGTPWRFTWELVPSDGRTSCGANRIVLGSWVPGDPSATGMVNTLPDTSFTFTRKLDLRSRAWHTFAIEITGARISWFVDTKVIRTETRPAALAGVKYRPELVMEPTPAATMRPSWFQADWVRYYTLKRPDAQSTTAPAMKLTTSTSTCSVG